MSTRPSSDSRSSPSTATNTAQPAAQHIRPPLPAVDAAKLREAIADLMKLTRNSTPTRAMKFGQYIRQVVDASPESTEGVLAMGKFLRLDPAGKAIEKLENELAATKADIDKLRRLSRKPEAPKDGRSKDVDHALAKLKKKILSELKAGGSTRAEAESALIPELKSKSPATLSRMLKDKLNIRISGRTIGSKQQGGDFKSQTVAEWSQFRNIPGVRPPLKTLPCSVDDQDPEKDDRPRAVDKSRIDASEAVMGAKEIEKGKLRQTTRVCAGYGRLRKRSGDDFCERHAELEGDAILTRSKEDPYNVEFRAIDGRPPATGKDQD